MALDDGKSAFAMSLRDWFAGQAMAGFCTEGLGGSYSHIAADAFKMADAMLKAREAGDDA